MTKQKSTKRALLLSALSVLVCLAMLVGSTFAWFTDSVTSTGNKIVAGSLDVQLLMDTGAGYEDISDSTAPIFGAGSIAQNNNAETLWEPGKTQVAYLAIKNNGSLALKYKVALDVENVSKDLYKVMEYAIVPDAQFGTVTAWNGGNNVVIGKQEVSGEVALGKGEVHYFALAIHMNEEAGNEYQDGQVNFDLTVLATQNTVEADYFNNQYDIFADYDGEISNVASFQSAVNEGGTYKVTDDFEVSEPVNVEGGKEVVLDLNGKSITATSDDGYAINNENGGTLIIGDSTASANSTTFARRAAVGSAINGVVYTADGSTTIINGGTYNAVDDGNFVFLNSSGTLEINGATINAGSSYPIYSYNENHKLVINDVTINASFGCVNAYGKGGTVVINGGTFNMTGVQGKTSHIAYFSTGSDVTINGGSFNKIGDINMSGTGGGGICAINGAKLTINGGSFAGDYADVYNWGGSGTEIKIVGGSFKFKPAVADGYMAVKVADGYTVISNEYEKTDYEGLYKKDGAYCVYNAEGFAALNNMMVNKTADKVTTVKLCADIDMAGKTWTPVDSHVDFGFSLAEIDGQGHTISNLTVNGQAMFTRFASIGDVTIKDLTFDNATVNSNGSINTAVIVGQTYQNVLMDNVDVINSSVTGGYKVAPLIATVYNESDSTITATLKNCDVENVTVKATSYDFCTTGMVAFVYTGNNDKVEFENCTVSDVELYAPNVYTAHAAVYTEGSDTLHDEVDGVTVTNVTFENI